MKYIKSFADTSAMNEFIENTTENGYYLLRDESKVGSERINYVRINNRTEFCFVALENNSQVSFSRGDRNLQYSVNDGDTWIDYDTADTAVNLTTGQKMYWRRTVNTEFDGAVGNFKLTGSLNAKGNIMSLVAADYENLTTVHDNEFHSIFQDCTGLTNYFGSLPAMNLAESCYSYMFSGCSALTSAPELPATTLADSCYAYMFYRCISLQNAPALPATTLADYCYYYMFSGCTALTSAPALPATTLANYCCYGNMFEGCTSLITAPALPAETIIYQCYENMFSECCSLNYIKCLATTGMGWANNKDWVKNVSSTGTFYKKRGVEWPTDDFSGIPANWTVVEVDE